MPSPFPGMDPYLEDPGRWPDVHHRLISIAGDTLNAQLRPKYYVRIEERVYVSDPLDPGRSVIIPDLRVARALSARKASRQGAPASSAVAESVLATTLIDDEIHERRLKVIDRAQRSVVAIIEILSPSNKVRGSRGNESYYQKRLEVMNSPSHFIEIDLLRAGERIPVLEGTPDCDYLVHVSRVERRPKGTMWPISIRQQLPTIPIPLHGGDPDAPLELQAVLSTAYERANYDLEIDYSAEPTPPLSSEDAVWARNLLASRI